MFDVKEQYVHPYYFYPLLGSRQQRDFHGAYTGDAAAEAGTGPARQTFHGLVPDILVLREWETYSAEGNRIDLIPELDRIKYFPEKENYCKILINGQEPDFRGVRAVNRNGCIWGNVLCVLDRIRQIAPDRMDYAWDPADGTLTMCSGDRRLVVRMGETYLLEDGQENLMDGQPLVTEEEIPVMEVSMLAFRVECASVQFDDRIGALRISILKN